MGAKIAGLHFRCDDGDQALQRLAQEFQAKPAPSKKDQFMLEMLRAMAEKSIAGTSDPQEKAEKEAAVAQILGDSELDMEAGAAVIVQRPRFLSLYWDDRIRVDNLDQMLRKFAAKLELPAWAAAVYDDDNFIIQVVDLRGGEKKFCQGLYWFAEDDVQPADPAELCRIGDAPFLLDGLTATLAQPDGESRAAAFEQATGLHIYLDAEDCRGLGYQLIDKWGGAMVFAAGNEV